MTKLCLRGACFWRNLFHVANKTTGEEMTASHTPTPWCLTKDRLIKQDYRHIGLPETAGVLIGSTCGHPSSGFYPTDEEGHANAVFIVKAANSHCQLVDALADALDSLEYVEGNFPAMPGYAVRKERIAAARAALAAAEAK
jgi:hypothetical protein